jgi:hypothetical protein
MTCFTWWPASDAKWSTGFASTGQYLACRTKGSPVIKRSRWLLLRNRDNLKAEQAFKLEELLAANQPLARVCMLTTELKESGMRPQSGKLLVAGKPGSNSFWKAGS